ncbi:MAG: hypothetical protein Q9187_007014 [Circinaria calcarea]
MQPKPNITAVKNNGTLLLKRMNDPSRSFLERFGALQQLRNDLVRQGDKTAWMAEDAARTARQVHMSWMNFLEKQPQLPSGHNSWTELPQKAANVEKIAKEFIGKLDDAKEYMKTIGKELSEKKMGAPAKWFLDIPEEAWLTFMNALEELWCSMREVDDFLVDLDILHSNVS